jgi:hypothetical protein
MTKRKSLRYVHLLSLQSPELYRIESRLVALSATAAEADLMAYKIDKW